MQVTTKELLAMFKAQRACVPISMICCTVPKVKKTCPYTNLVKVSKVNGLVGADYSNSVNNQLSREDKAMEFEAKPRQWGTKVPNSPVVEHTNKAGVYKEYVEIQVQTTSGKPRFFSNGKPISVGKLRPYFYAKGKSRQGTDKEVVIRDYGLPSIARVHMGGKQFSVV